MPEPMARPLEGIHFRAASGNTVTQWRESAVVRNVRSGPLAAKSGPPAGKALRSGRGRPRQRAFCGPHRHRRLQVPRERAGRKALVPRGHLPEPRVRGARPTQPFGLPAARPPPGGRPPACASSCGSGPSWWQEQVGAAAVGRGWGPKEEEPPSCHVQQHRLGPGHDRGSAHSWTPVAPQPVARGGQERAERGQPRAPAASAMEAAGQRHHSPQAPLPAPRNPSALQWASRLLAPRPLLQDGER